MNQRERYRMTRPDVAAQLVSEILQQQARRVEESRRRQEETRQRRRRRARTWYLLGLLPLLVGLTMWNLMRAEAVPSVFTPDEVVAGVRFKIFLAAQTVQAFRDSAGRFPSSLGEVGMAEDGLRYALVGATYVISDTAGAVPLTYRGGEDLSLFASAYQQLASGARR